jgi:FdhD protein
MTSATGTSRIEVQKFQNGQSQNVKDTLAVEEPLEIRLEYGPENQRQQKSISITMRTPGSDFDLALGFLFTEGLIDKKSDVLSIDYCGPILKHLGHSNIVKVKLSPTIGLKLGSLDRNFYTTSSCGVCGKASIEALQTKNIYSKLSQSEKSLKIDKNNLVSLPEKLRSSQDVFDSTGGLHASGLFSPQGDLIALREDVGRHNALDKLIGLGFQNGKLPLQNTLLMLSGRISFELVQKASMAAIPVIAAIGAPSSLALELALEMNITLIGFLREKRFNVYSGAQRII